MRTIYIIVLLIITVNSSWAQTTEDYFKPLKFRNIGPFRGGRSVTATGVVGDPQTYYMGTTGGGLWKTTDAGQIWANISDGYFKTGSVGAVTVAPSNSNIVYCGMGEHAPRGVMTSYGDGMYKSLDAGKTWIKIGLDATQHIARIVVHPTNPDIVYVAAQGALYAPNQDRGIFKTTDGGKTWEKIMYINNLTGCSELVMHPNNPEILYAAMWHHQRTPNQVISGGKGSGIYTSTDGGKTWNTIHNGLPEEKGKMAIAIAKTNPDKLYALVESDSNLDKGGLFISNDAGKSWNMVSGDNRLVQRAWYYIEVFADPNDENTVYVLSADAFRSEDGGKTWETLSGTHGDYHDLWINPNNSKNMVIANDGGAAISFNYGTSWSTQNNMPTSQIYRINTDNLFPYNIYGGQQDNTSLRIANMSIGSWSINEKDWTDTAGGESAFLAFDPNNPKYVLGGSYLGTIEVLDMETKTSTKIMAAPIQYLGRAARDMKYLYNWNAPIVWDPHQKDTYYHCAQYVLKTQDWGKTWQEISPDLSRNIDEKQGKGGAPYTNEAVGAENYGTIAYMVISPHEEGVFYTGSDDGFVHLTKNGGKSWENITPKGLEECLINAIEVSPHNPATAYIATTRYKFNDYTPAIYKTTNYGKNWTKISSGIPYGAFTRVVREDTQRENLLFAGTELGLYISWNGGKQWEPFQLNLPVTPITDLKIHQSDLVVATSGRSFWILDNLNLLAQYQPSKNMVLYQPENSLIANWGSALNSNSNNGTDPLNGVNPASGMVIYYQLPELENTTEVTLEIHNTKGNLVRTFTSVKDTTYIPHHGGGAPPKPVLTTHKGLNRFVWDMRHPIIPGIPNVYIEAGFRGHRAIPGTYSLTLKSGNQSAQTSATITTMPKVVYDEHQFNAYDAIMTDMEQQITDMHNKINTLFKIKNQLNTIVKSLQNDAVKIKGENLLKKITAWDAEMVQRKSQAYDDVENFENKFSAEYLFLLNQTDNETFRINQSSISRKKELDNQWQILKAQAEVLLNQEIPAFNKELWELGIGAIRF